MANRRFTANKQLRVTDNASRPKPGMSGKESMGKFSESKPPYKGAGGPKRRGSYSVAGFNKVKIRVQEDL